MSKAERSWLAQEFVEEFGLPAYDLLCATAQKHDPKRFDFAAKKAMTFGPLGYDHFCAALHIIERHGCLKSMGDLHHFEKVFDRESVYQWLHGDPARRVWSVAFNPYEKDGQARDFLGAQWSSSQITNLASEIASRTGVPGFLFLHSPLMPFVVDAKSQYTAGSYTTQDAVVLKKLWKQSKKKPNVTTLGQAKKTEDAMKLASKLIDEIIADEAKALPKWMPDVP